MNRTIRIFLGDEARPVGVLRYDQQGARESASFEYDAAWLASESRFAIEPGLPLVAETVAWWVAQPEGRYSLDEVAGILYRSLSHFIAPPAQEGIT
jgi:hypothetical protein